MDETLDGLDALRLELRRGVIVLAVLSQTGAPAYGYKLIQQLAEAGFPIEEGTLYPLLRRLEKQGQLDSSWDTTESRPRKYYVISAAGRDALAVLSREWAETVHVMQRLLGAPK
jgi:PadR family transcriptional regulator, regulatory protein PadR